MPIDWKTPESYKRLLAAMCASQEGNIDFKKVAYYYGQGATYDSIEGRFRHARKEAKLLQKEAVDEGRQMPVTRPKSAVSTPRKPKATPSTEDRVKSGRVTKSPSKKSKKSTTGNMSPTIKLELDSSSSAAATPSSWDSDMMPQNENTFFSYNDMGFVNPGALSNDVSEEYQEV
ncbi:hypothetical protein IWX90DRAFT_430929 [Phyllosticta citrichinensis]|uniref:Uncharacterized protein n=1 Tax=Phyllosticta citrichinensis TaxID=1130410 RepID=A0ABR1XWR8_9PEZI